MGSQLLVVYVRLYLHVYLLVLYGCQGRLSDVSERESYRYCNNKYENYYTHTRSTLSSLSFVPLSLLPRTSIELRVICVYFVFPRRLISYTHSFALDIYYDYYLLKHPIKHMHTHTHIYVRLFSFFVMRLETLVKWILCVISFNHMVDNFVGDEEKKKLRILTTQFTGCHIKKHISTLHATL